MANEITLTISGNLKNPAGTTVGLIDEFNYGTKLLTQTTAIMFKRVVTCTTSDTVLTLSGITTPGLVMLYNLDSTNYVEWGPTSGGAIVKVGKLTPQGAPAVFNAFGSVTLRTQANTASCNVLVVVYEV